jgi:carbamoyl-phosphate synthase small subunit
VLLLEDGTLFEGTAIAPGTRFGEVVFNTSMTGYQEILTDPSYLGQIVVMTQPHIGNYGVSPAAAESSHPWVEGFVARRFTRRASSHGSTMDLPAYLRRSEVPALENIDTRALVRALRSRGAMRGVLTSETGDLDKLAQRLAAFPSMSGRALVDDVTCARPYEVAPPAGIDVRCRLAVLDFGVKENILRSLSQRGAHLIVLPASSTRAEVERLGVDGVVLSNGPGDPEPLTSITANVAELIDSGTPILGICLGHQLLGLALGGTTFKLKFGHHGGNQPVVDRRSGKVLITSQNHGFAVAPESLPATCTITEVNLNDGTVEAFSVADRPILSAQYHPEAAPGPHDAADLFDRFLELVGEA